MLGAMAGMFRNPRIVALVLAVALVAGACGGKDNTGKTSTTSRKTTTTASSGDTTTTSEVGGTTTTRQGATTTTVKGATPPKTGNTTAPANAAGAPSPAAPGTYDYAQSGTTSQGDIPPNGTLVVSGAGPSQTFQRYVDANEAPSDLYYVFRDDGPFVTRIVVRAQGFTMSCGFGAPVPAPPWPATDGRSFSGHSTCDNGFVADFSGSITGHRSDSVGGKSVPVVVIESALHITGTLFGAKIDENVKDTQHWAPSLRVPTYSHEVASGSFSGDFTSTLKSTSPH
jgi:hypothetical protein